MTNLRVAGEEALALVYTCKDKPEGLQVIPGFCGLSAKAYGELKYSIYKKSKEFWRAGRAGFTFSTDRGFSRLPGYDEEFAGIWIFPEVGQAIAKREELIAEGWNCKLFSWPE